MIDTVVLTIPETNYRIIDHTMFTPSTDTLDSPVGFGGKAFAKYSQNPSKEDYEKGIYKPRLTITKRAVKGGFIKPLKIELSVSKLLFLENVTELIDEDFVRVVEMLMLRLSDMGIEMSKAGLQTAQVSTIHYSKNIQLPAFITASMVIKELTKVDITKRLSLDKTLFKNQGHALTFYAKSYSIVVYDKIKDILQGSGVRIDKDNTSFQQNLFTKNEPSPEILRIEIRLNLHSKILSLLKAIEEPADRSFIRLFSSRISQRVIKYYWNTMTQGINQTLFTSDSRMDSIAEEIYKSNPKISAQKLLSTLAFISYAKQHGTRSLRLFIEARYTTRTWFRISKDVKRYSQLPNSTHQLKLLLEIAKSIDEYKPLKIIDFREKTINNGV